MSRDASPAIAFMQDAIVLLILLRLRSRLGLQPVEARCGRGWIASWLGWRRAPSGIGLQPVQPRLLRCQPVSISLRVRHLDLGAAFDGRLGSPPLRFRGPVRYRGLDAVPCGRLHVPDHAVFGLRQLGWCDRVRIPTKPAGDSDLKPAVVPRRSRPPFRSEAGRWRRRSRGSEVKITGSVQQVKR